MNMLSMLKDMVGALTGLAVSVIVFGVAANVAFGGRCSFCWRNSRCRSWILLVRLVMQV